MRALGLVLTTITMACGGADPAPRSAGSDLDLSQPPRATAGDQALLWRVRAPGGTTSYVLGTIHVGVGASELSPSVWAALQRSQSYVMETDIDAASRAEPSPAPRARDVLADSDWRHLVELLGARRARALSTMGVDQVYGAVLQALYPNVTASMDVELARAADSRGLGLRYLEDWRWQLELGRKYWDEDELESVLDPAGSGRRELDSLVAAYRRGDIEALEAMALDPAAIADEPQRYRDLFFDRNRAWAGELSRWMAAESCFVAVGVGHLPGERGLLDLLRQRGFAVERVGTDP